MPYYKIVRITDLGVYLPEEIVYEDSDDSPVDEWTVYCEKLGEDYVKADQRRNVCTSKSKEKRTN